MKERIVDIIIPVYNAYDFTKACINSVIANTDLSRHTLVVINDMSPDDRIAPMLKDFEVRYSKTLNVKFINNEENLGFVGTVNKGMTLSDHDVLLLNSDTEVTKGWLDKMIVCGDSKPMVATVTPLSNNATLASVPVFLKENNIPEGFTMEEFAQEIERCSMKLYPEISTAHGFCMYIKREAIERIGLFDVDAFGKGYGEENDFSYRCLQHGYRHLLCDNTFIYHKGTQSFSPQAAAKVEEHMGILRERYPVQTHNTDVLVIENPTGYIQANLIMQIINKRRKNLLYVIHDFRDRTEKNIGGTTLHLYDLIDNLRKEMNVHVLYFDVHDIFHRICRLKSYYADFEIEYPLGSYEQYTDINMYNDDFNKKLEILMQYLCIDLVHIHHIKDLFLDVFDVANKLNIPSFFTFHDYYMVCPTIQLLDADGRTCDGRPTDRCNKCLAKRQELRRIDVSLWQEHMYSRLKKAAMLFAPSTSAHDIIKNIYPELDIHVCEHGYDIKPLTNNLQPLEDDHRFHIAMVGGISKIKGLDYLMQLIAKAKGTDIVVHLFGVTSVQVLNENQGTHYIYHGMYGREELASLLNKNRIKLVLMLQIWPETYSYTLSECMAAHIPVLGFDIGAVGERVKKGNCGYLMPVGSSVDEVYSKIKSICKDTESYQQKVEGILNTLKKEKSIEQMVDVYRQAYRKHMKQERTYSDTVVTPMMYDYLFRDKYLERNRIIPNYEKPHVDEYMRVKNILKDGCISDKEARQEYEAFMTTWPDEHQKRKMRRKFLWYRVLGFKKK